ncbi:antitoxin [Streptomyces palmae]|uniref:Antitoxin n=1 Tax=Streptomyces palmae TaxID=1701085 RepID=A0A4Z0H644_9ACTN|nr:antitoxin [Streptomyces palmae]TGB07919.1 antitoxin [Streptomyces palmae]
MSLKDSMKNLKDKVTGAARQHPDQAGKGVDAAAGQADRRTGGKHTDQIDRGADQAKKSFGSGGDQGST